MSGAVPLRRSEPAPDPPAVAGVVAAPAPRRDPGLLRCQADHGQGVWRPPLYEGSATGAAAGSEDSRPILPVPALRGESGPGPLGLLPRQGCRLRLPVPAGSPVVSPGPVRIAFDRDPAHPIEARVTRRRGGDYASTGPACPSGARTTTRRKRSSATSSRTSSTTATTPRCRRRADASAAI